MYREDAWRTLEACGRQTNPFDRQVFFHIRRVCGVFGERVREAASSHRDASRVLEAFGLGPRFAIGKDAK